MRLPRRTISSFPFGTINMATKMANIATKKICWQKWSGLVSIKRLAQMGYTMRISPFGTMNVATKMADIATKKICWQKWSGLVSIKRLAQMGHTMRISHLG